MQNRICLNCGNQLPADRKNQKFCSRRCYLESDSAQNVVAVDPSLQEIRERSAIIRDEWSAEVLYERTRPDCRSVPWTAPLVRVMGQA